MISLYEYLSIQTKQSRIKANDSTIYTIVKEELNKLGPDADLNHIDVSECTKFDELFEKQYRYKKGFTRSNINPDISKWDTRNVTTLSLTFSNCSSFNCDISDWNVENVRYFISCFNNCKKFNQPIGKWNVGEKISKNNLLMSWMFYGCDEFNQPLNNWDASKMQYISNMFRKAKSFNQDISNWDLINCENHDHMFDDCPIKESYKPKFKKKL